MRPIRQHLRQHLVLVPWPGTPAARVIDAGSGIVCEPGPVPPKVTVYFEGNRYNAVNLHRFEERVQCASGRLATHYPTAACGEFSLADFRVVGAYEFTEDFQQRWLVVYDEMKNALKAWLLLKPSIFKQTVPCSDCPFRRVGGVRHGAAQMLAYAHYFVGQPGATFPCHKSVPQDDPRDRWSEWSDGQVLCSGGLLFAAKQGIQNGIVRVGVANGWYDPGKHRPEELALVFDTIIEMLEATQSASAHGEL